MNTLFINVQQIMVIYLKQFEENLGNLNQVVPAKTCRVRIININGDVYLNDTDQTETVSDVNFTSSDRSSLERRKGDTKI